MDTDYTGKCFTCKHYETHKGKAGYCYKRPYGSDVRCGDMKRFQIVAACRKACKHFEISEASTTVYDGQGGNK